MSTMASMMAGPKLRGYDWKDHEEKVLATGAFELPTVSDFIAACLNGNMPGGVRTTLPLLTEEGMKLYSTDYQDWAPEPWKSLPGPQGPFGPMSGRSPPPVFRVMTVMSGLEEIFSEALGPRRIPDKVERSFKSMKTKTWLGMTPISDARWRAKGLDAPENIEEALSIIQQVIDVWEYMQRPQIQGNIRHVHNKIWVEIDVFQDAVHAYYGAMSRIPPFNLSSLFYEYMDRHFNHMEVQARSFIFTRLAILHNVWKDRFLAKFQSGRVLSETHATVWIDHYSMMILNKIYDMYADADIFVRSRTEGFINEGRTIEPTMANIDGPKEELERAYKAIQDQRIKDMRAVLKSFVDSRGVDRRAAMAPRTPIFLEGPGLMTDREWGHKAIQGQITNPLKREVEGWVLAQSENKVEKFGFVIYRLTYSETDKEWGDFLERLECGINSGWEGIVRGEEVRRKATLYWIDGREEKIAEGDMEAARKDFKIIKGLPSFPTGINKTTFLAITPQSIKSFADTRAGDRKGDYRGYIHVIDANFKDSTQQEDNPAAYNKAYDGTFKIIDQLLWTDLFAIRVVSAGQSLYEYWALSMEHPWGVYVGPTTGVRRRIWREMKNGLGVMFRAGAGS